MISSSVDPYLVSVYIGNTGYPVGNGPAIIGLIRSRRTACCIGIFRFGVTAHLLLGHIICILVAFRIVFIQIFVAIGISTPNRINAGHGFFFRTRFGRDPSQCQVDLIIVCVYPFTVYPNFGSVQFLSSRYCICNLRPVISLICFCAIRFCIGILRSRISCCRFLCCIIGVFISLCVIFIKIFKCVCVSGPLSHLAGH